jgi:TetR/AcrR family transcriptional repressor of nem operon
MPKLKEAIFLEKRQHILMCARQVFASQGYEATRIQHILKAAGISNGALFVYFQSKRDILLAIIDENLGMFCQRIDEIADLSHELEREETLVMLLELVRQISLGAGRAMSLHVWSASMVDDVIKSHTQMHYKRILRSITKLLSSLRKKGKLEESVNVNKAAFALFALFIPGYIVQMLFISPMEPRAYLDAHRDLW